MIHPSERLKGLEDLEGFPKSKLSACLWKVQKMKDPWEKNSKLCVKFPCRNWTKNFVM
jgi:hypothetical protein